MAAAVVASSPVLGTGEAVQTCRLRKRFGDIAWPCRPGRRPGPLPAGLLALFRFQHLVPKGDELTKTQGVRLDAAAADAPFLQQVALGSKHFHYQLPPVVPWSFSDHDLGRIGAPSLLLVAGRETLDDPRRAFGRAYRLLLNLRACTQEALQVAGVLTPVDVVGHSQATLCQLASPSPPRGAPQPGPGRNLP